MLLERTILKEILYTACLILKKHFFYDEESITHFLDDFTNEMIFGYGCFDEKADEETRLRLKYDRKARALFTNYFASANLHDILINYLHFSEQELEAFENILPRYAGVTDDVKPSNKRAYH